jgi:hypothetical protein
MRTAPQSNFTRGSRVWVWDSTWLPAVVIQYGQTDAISVRLEHGVTFRVAIANVAVRDPARNGSDLPKFRGAFDSAVPQNRIGNAANSLHNLV